METEINGFALILVHGNIMDFSSRLVRILEILVYIGDLTLTWRHDYSADDNVLIRDRYLLLELYNAG